MKWDTISVCCMILMKLMEELDKNGLIKTDNQNDSQTSDEQEKKQKRTLNSQKFLWTLCQNWVKENKTPPGSSDKPGKQCGAEQEESKRTDTYPASELAVNIDSKLGGDNEKDEVVTLEYSSIPFNSDGNVEFDKFNEFNVCAVFATNADRFKIMGEKETITYVTRDSVSREGKVMVEEVENVITGHVYGKLLYENTIFRFQFY